MTDPITPVRDPRLEALGREYADLAAVKAATDARLEEIKAEFRNALDYGTVGIANLSVQIGRNVTRDNERFMADFPREENPDLYVDALNTKAINKEFAPSTLEQYQILGAPRVTVKVLEDVTGMTAAIVHLLDDRHQDNGVCGAVLLPWPQTPQADWNWSDDRHEVTCPACADRADEAHFERDEERRLEQAGMAAYERAVDADIERRMGGE